MTNGTSNATSAKVIGQRGLVIFSGDKYYTVNEGDWRKLPALDAQQSGQKLKTLVDCKVALALLDNSVFVDLDQLQDLRPTPGARVGTNPPVAGQLRLAERSVVVKEGNAVVVVPQSSWQEIDPGISGDARVLVNRGAVLAAIPPSIIRLGTFCVLVNFSGVGSPGPQPPPEP
jgi:hypothetical protein